MTHAIERDSVARISRYTLIVLILADLGLIALYAVSALIAFISDTSISAVANLNEPSSLSSSYNYWKYFFAVVFLLPLWLFHRRAGYAWIAALFLVFLCDDVLELHDQWGRWIGGWLSAGPMAAMAPQDRGEPFVYAGLLAIALALLALARRDMTHSFHKAWLKFALAVAALAFFGAGVDMLHGVVKSLAGDGTTVARVLNFFFNIVEDGGESLVLTLILWLTIDEVLHAPRSTQAAHSA